MRRTPHLITLIVLFGMLAASVVTAQEKKYVLTAPTWGAEEDQAVTAAGGTVEFSNAKSGVAIARSSAPDFLKDATKGRLKGAEDVEVQWVTPLREVEQDVDLSDEAVTPGDETFINEQWNVQSMEAPAAWALGYTGAGVRVAILDGAIHNLHLDLDGNLDVGASRSFVPGFAYNQDVGTFWHGTHVAGIVAAEDNGIGTIGVAPGATLIGVKVLHNGSGSFGQVIQGILYAATPLAEGGGGADIINMSLGATFNKGGGPGAGQLIAAITRAVNFATDNNVLVVSSAGNSALDLDHTGNIIVVPAQAGSGIAVSATGPVGYAVGWPNGATNFRRPASYSNYGTSLVWVAGPGGDFALPGNAVCSIPRCCGGNVVQFCWVRDMVMSTVRGSGAAIATYSWAAGTSMAAPAVCGVAALIKQRFPGISVGDLKTKLAQTADNEGGGGSDPFYGKGFVNARRAVTE